MTTILLAGLLTSVQPIALEEPPPRQPWSESRKAETTYLVCGAADLATTAIGLHNGLEEGNPILKGDSDGETLARAFALKAAFYGFAKITKAPPWVYRLAGYPQCAAAIWNVGKIASK